MPRENYRAIAPDAIRKLVELSTLLHKGNLPAGLIHLVYLRASQINGCAYCVDSHTRNHSGSTTSRSGARRRSFRRKSALPWPGPRR
ncbi:MAG TPA: carboxymuconolactone decarboxylase family protein [Stellaceae bacterium]|jgi:alkylhydroperoxidase family enzyme